MREDFLIKLLIEICVETINQIFSINVLFANIFIVSHTTKNNFTSSRISFSECNYWSSDSERKSRENESQEKKKWEGNGMEVWLGNQTLGFD